MNSIGGAEMQPAEAGVPQTDLEIIVSLPEYVVLKCKYNKYLEYVKEGEVQGYVRFSSEDVHSPQSKFHVERAVCDSQLVHLRCCYNNKYLVASNSRWILPEADKPEENQSLWFCTLFHPVPCCRDGYRFKHVKSGNYAVLMRMGDSDPKNNCLYPGWSDPNSDLCDVCTVIDWKSLLLVLPRHVAFKIDDCFYGVAHPHRLQTATFDSGDPIVAQEVFPNPDGSVRIKSTYTGKFWMRGYDNWIWADSDTQDGSDINTLFWPVKIDDNAIALRSLGNNQFCKKLDARGVYGCLNASISSISKEARLTVTELVLDRDIYNVNYHLSQARRYDEHAVGVPMIVEGKIEISAELTTAFQWGVVHTKTNTVQTVYKAFVPPMTKVTVTVVGTTAKCDIPFSYTQTDTLIDGTRHTYEMGGGTYTGVNTFNVTYQIKEEKINITE